MISCTYETAICCYLKENCVSEYVNIFVTQCQRLKIMKGIETRVQKKAIFTISMTLEINMPTCGD